MSTVLWVHRSLLGEAEGTEPGSNGEVEFRDVVTKWMASQAHGRLKFQGVDATNGATADGLPSKLRRVKGSSKERYVTCMPLVPLQVATGAFSNSAWELRRGRRSLDETPSAPPS